MVEAPIPAVRPSPAASSCRSIGVSVSASDWGVAAVNICLALLCYLLDSYSALTTVSACMATLNAALLLMTLRQATRTGVVGKLLLTAGTLVYFNIEALAAGLQETSFGATRGLFISTGQYDIALIRKAMLLIALFQFSLYLGYASQLPHKRLQKWASSRCDSRSIFSSGLRVVFSACLIVGLLAYNSFSPTATWSSLMASYRRLEMGLQGDTLLESLIIVGLYGAAVSFVKGYLT